MAGPVHLEPRSEGMTITEMVDGKLVCRVATRDEAAMFSRGNAPLHVMYPAPGQVRMSAGLQMTLLATDQLEANPTAKAAFIRAAQLWESKIANPVTISIRADFGTSRFGVDYPAPNILGSASGKEFYVNYPAVRTQLITRANNAAETSLYNTLPVGTVPTNLGAAARVLGTSLQLKTLGFTLPTDAPLPDIGFNSAFPFDFDPSNGITPGVTDFDAVVVHELGHILGFGSFTGATELDNGPTEVSPTIWDLFRFRPGVTLGTFQSAQRPMSSGGDHVSFFGGASFAMSTGRPDGNGGDEQQASHWKDDALTGVRIGIMDPNIASGVRSQVNDNDLAAFAIMGYDIVSGTTPVTTVPNAPTNLTATATSTSVIRLNWTDNSSDETEFRIEQRASNGSFVDLGSADANATTINVTSFQPNFTATFRVRARNAAGNSAYTNEATATTFSTGTGCTPSANVVCLLSNRFRVSIDYINAFVNPPQPGKFIGAKLVAGTQNPDVATFGISSAQAIEVVVRIQDARPFGVNRFDIYYGGLTDLEYTVTVTDTTTGTTRTYRNAPGSVGGGVDRTSFAGLLGGEERITSGGYDSFIAERELQAAPLETFTIHTSAPAKGTAQVEPALVQRRMEGLTLTPNRIGGGGACAEVEPNQSLAQASPLPLNDPCTGFVDLLNVGTITAGTDSIEDVFKVTLPGSARLNVVLTFTNSASDLDLYIFDSAFDEKGYSAGVETTESATTDILPAGTYYIGVSAYSGQSNYTLTASAVGLVQQPSAPSNLTATAISSTQINLAWADNSNNETGFVVEARVGNSGFAQVGDPIPANVNAVTVNGAVGGVTYTFRVKARNASGDSGYSNEASATTPSTGNPSTCTTSSTVACLLDGRFRVSIAFVNAFVNPPQPGDFLGVKLVGGSQNPDVATFGISSPQAIEAVVRIQDTRPFGLNRFDVYYGGLTDLEYTVTITDVQKGVTRTYRKAPGEVKGGVDRTSFTTN
ncbi:MAG TPA: NF038122 family metalloprotease [Thermoanaerobaculia bacterium]|nr:NF038122 family metalloprotease [Thermoanaerobaculia bacterium]